MVGGGLMVGSRFMVHSRLMVGGRSCVRGRGSIWGRCNMWGRYSIWSRCNIRGRCGILGWFEVWSRCVIRGGFRSMSFTRITMNTVLEITSANILVKDSAVSTLESVLLAILMAEVVDLTTCLSICVVPARVWLATAVKVGVRLRHTDRKGLDGLHLVGFALEKDWLLRSWWTVGCRDVCGFRGIGRLRLSISRLYCISWGRGVSRY